ncbi:DUF5777 domain-containing protein [Flavobacterium gelidilacus]|uniref:DUF5777 family beta-barrel protein n=1 Tax=Flavobacterium gelidilacus TaxID=206041 RepID=UPI00041D7C8F|nr:DUF5777 family beta-barrel protein [Flavobacterium gelidilacus]
MKLTKVTHLLFLFLAFNLANAQDDLLDQLDSIQPKEKGIATAAFKGLQVCNMQSTKLPVKGEFYFLVSHRFGDLSNGLDNFFGLDNALTKIGGIWGVTNWLSLGASRHTYNKTYELAAKYKFISQREEGFPFTIVGYNTMDINSDLKKDNNPQLVFQNRLQYSSQLIISRKFSESFSMQVLPIFVHKNLYDNTIDQKETFLIGAGGRYKLSKRLSLNAEYAYRTNVDSGLSNSPFNNPLTVGLDIETGGHVFQLVFANSQPMNDVAMLTNARGNWDFKRGPLYFGFNMYRVF